MNSVDTTLFRPIDNKSEKVNLRQQLGLPIIATILIFVGSVIHRKGVDVLVEAFIRLRQNNPDVFLLLVGPHTLKENPSLDEKWVASLEQRLVETNSATNARFLGLVSDRQILADLYRASDIFVFPSRVEGLGNVILEAMASGLPVVVSDLPVFKGVVNNTVNGITVRLEDVSDTEHTVLELINHPVIAEGYAKKAREDAVQQFSFSSWQSRLVEIYQSLSNKKNEK